VLFKKRMESLRNQTSRKRGECKPPFLHFIVALHNGTRPSDGEPGNPDGYRAREAGKNMSRTLSRRVLRAPEKGGWKHQRVVRKDTSQGRQRGPQT